VKNALRVIDNQPQLTHSHGARTENSV